MNLIITKETLQNIRSGLLTLLTVIINNNHRLKFVAAVNTPHGILRSRIKHECKK